MRLLERLDSVPGGHVAVISGQREITYAELNRDSSRLAERIRKRLPAGELLAIWMENRPELLALCLACWKAGVVPLLLHARMKWPEVRGILDRSGTRYLCAARVLAESPGIDLSDTGLEIVLDGDDPELAVLPAVPGITGRAARGRVPVPRECRLVLHTSGTTGRARGVMLSQSGLEAILECRIAVAGFDKNSLAVVASCLTQSVGLYQSLALLAAGGTMVLLEDYDAGRIADCVNRHLPTHLIMVVEAFDRLLDHHGIDGRSFSRTVFAAVGADRVTARVHERFLALTGRRLHGTYGLTESSWALINDGTRPDKLLSLGRPAPGVSVILLDDGTVPPRGQAGEIHLRSPRTMLGFLDDAEATRSAFRNGWLASGDLAWQDADGYYWFTGRSKNMIVLGSGDTVSPVEIENVLLGHPGVACCSVVGISDPGGSEVPWAFVTRRNGTVTATQLADLLRANLSDYKIPRAIMFLPELPVGASGKICRESLRSLAAAGELVPA